jgi:S1-C subfamily serine protease
VLREISERTCAIGVLKIADEEFAANFQRPVFKILGTGFLVAERTVLTNRHVLQNVFMYLQKEHLAGDRQHVSFVRRHPQGAVQELRRFAKAGAVLDPHIDLGVITYAPEPTPQNELSPVRLRSNFESEIGDPVAVLGYPYGEALQLRSDEEVLYRFGPVLQQGYISALAPHEHTDIVDRVLLDVRTSIGMSGAPVFDPESGEVLAIHSAGLDGTVAFAIPLSADLIASILPTHLAAEADVVTQAARIVVRRSKLSG